MAEDDPIFEAVKNGDLSELKRYMADGGDIEVRTSINETPLIWAASHGHLEIVKYLVEKGADIDAQLASYRFTTKTRSAGSFVSLCALVPWW